MIKILELTKLNNKVICMLTPSFVYSWNYFLFFKNYFILFTPYWKIARSNFFFSRRFIFRFWFKKNHYNIKTFQFFNVYRYILIKFFDYRSTATFSLKIFYNNFIFTFFILKQFYAEIFFFFCYRYTKMFHIYNYLYSTVWGKFSTKIFILKQKNQKLIQQQTWHFLL